LQLFVAIPCAGWPDQTKARVVDNKLRLGALCRQSLANQPRSAGFEEIGCDDDWPARAGPCDFLSQRVQSVFAPGNQRQFMAVLREYTGQRHADPR
jgi:hypothetical protein